MNQLNLDGLSCSICKQMFDNKMMKNNHKMLQHMVPLPYDCHKCGDQFPMETDLTFHFHNVCTPGLYDNNEQNTCNVCNHPSRGSWKGAYILKIFIPPPKHPSGSC